MVEDPLSKQHVQVSFFSKTESIPGVEGNIVDVPVDAGWENLNTLVNTLATTASGDWAEKRYELLVGNTFIRSTLKEFICEFGIETEKVIRIECISGHEPPKPGLSLSGPDWISSVHLLDKHILATSYNGEVIVWDRKGKNISGSCKESNALKCSCIINKPTRGLSGLRVASAGETGTVWIEEWVEEGPRVVCAMRGHERSVESVAVGARDTRLLSGGFDNTIKVWNLEASDSDVFEKASHAKAKKSKVDGFVTKTPMVTLAGHSDAVIGVSWSMEHEGRALSASWDHSILVWDLELAGEISRLRGSRAFTSLDVHPRTFDVITSSTDAIPRLYDQRSSEGSMVKQSFVGHKGWVSCVRWSPRDDFSFISASFDGTVKIWDKRSSKTCVFDLSGHTDRVLCCSWGSDGIISGGVDTKVNLFTT